MSLNQFTYTINEFDKENKTLRVSFDDGSWALINLVNPLPNTEEEIDNIVKQYTATKEIMEARSNSSDLTFIDNLVGSSRTAERFSTTPKEIPQSLPLNPGEVLL
jgi:hypothetical protein